MRRSFTSSLPHGFPGGSTAPVVVGEAQLSKNPPLDLPLAIVMINKHTFYFNKFFHKTRSRWVANHVKEWLATYTRLGSKRSYMSSNIFLKALYIST